MAAGRVDLANDATADQIGARAAFDAADELMARDAAITHVAARQLDVGAAYTGHRDADQALARRGRRLGDVGAEAQLVIEVKRAHRFAPSATLSGIAAPRSFETATSKSSQRFRRPRKAGQSNQN